MSWFVVFTLYEATFTPHQRAMRGLIFRIESIHPFKFIVIFSFPWGEKRPGMLVHCPLGAAGQGKPGREGPSMSAQIIILPGGAPGGKRHGEARRDGAGYGHM